MSFIVFSALVLAAIGSGIIGGIYFAFSTFIMQAFTEIPREHGMGAMQSINRVIVRSLFLPAFFGSAILSLFLIAAWWFGWGDLRSGYALAGALLYFVTSFVSTVVFNVPLNNELERTDAASPEAEAVWARYLQRWTKWNHLRTVTSLLAAIAFAIAAAEQEMS
ncbi:putative membrane protein [Parvibaculum indicum]|uniref:anthrone oxygenase family protein n=1 Tax=Parvibaculum indicum TaxID=562969 RepID=UPI00141D8C68|nr:anthrone oxygenase family protein [Parvibaculum indicum]NIJ43420.1 putative membrane protein [Parvibaculum indicum]